MSERQNSAAVRGAVGFLIGACVIAVALVGLYSVFSYIRMIIGIAGFALGGAIGGAGVCVRRDAGRRALPAALGFGLAFVLPSLVVPFSLMSLEGGGFAIIMGTLLWGVAFAIAGGIGAAFLRSGVAAIGAFGFGVGGALGGVVAFVLALVFPSSLSRMPWQAPVGVLIACVFGGWLLGTGLDSLGERKPGARDARTSG